jgi:hypothetical protein
MAMVVGRQIADFIDRIESVCDLMLFGTEVDARQHTGRRS